MDLLKVNRMSLKIAKRITLKNSTAVLSPNIDTSANAIFAEKKLISIMQRA